MTRCLALILLLLVAACSCAVPDAKRADPDPVTVAALSDPLMTDPDLASQSNASAALGGGGPALGEIPRERGDADLINAIRAEAEKAVGATLRAAEPGSEREPLPEALTPPAFAALLPGGAACSKGAGYGFVWTAAFPEAFPIYPRGHAQIAAGNDTQGCRLRAVRFTSPVPGEEIAAFYLTKAKALGLPLDYRKAGEALVLQGVKGKAVVLVRISPPADGIATVELATSGL